MGFGTTLKSLRQQHKLTLRDLAGKLKVDHAYLSRLECGSVPPSEKVLRHLARAFRVPAEELGLAAGKLPKDVVSIFYEHPKEAASLLRERFAVYNTTIAPNGRPENSNSGKSSDPRNVLNDLTSSEWIAETVSVWTQRGLGADHPDTQIERQHPAPFSFTDISRLIRFFTKKNGLVLDPFVGIGSTLKACALEGRRGIGIELNQRYARLAQERLDKEVRDLFATLSEQKILVGDSRKVVAQLESDSVDFVVTSPPYWNILHKEDHKVNQERKSQNLDTRYSDDRLDLGNIHHYETFLSEVAKVLGSCGRVLRPKKYMAVIVSDFRDKSQFAMFHADLANALKPYKLELRGLKMLYQRHKRVFPYGYPYAYVPNIHHQYILILQNAK